MSVEEIGDDGDGGAAAFHQRVAVARIADRILEHVAQRARLPKSRRISM